MSDTFTRITSESWLSRVGRSVVGVGVGGMLFVAALVLLFWNEGQAVTTARALAEGAASVVSIDPNRIDPANEGKLVHLVAEATTDERLEDDLFGVRTMVPSLRLHRTVEMYQWKENRRRESRRRSSTGREETVTTYTYNKGWDETLIDSENFGQGGHHNPKLKPFPSRDMTASPVRMGAFVLPEGLVTRINEWQTIPVTEETHAAMREDLRERVRVADGRFYLPALPDRPEQDDPLDPPDPAIGDARISFDVVRPTVVTVLARQAGNTFDPFPTKAGVPLIDLKVGVWSPADLFAQRRHENAVRTWVTRAAGFLGLWVGLAMALAPLKVLGDLLPPLGRLAGVGVGVVTFVAAAVVALLAVAFGWVFYRPLVGILLLAAAAALLFGMKAVARKRATTRRRPGRPAAAPPVPAG